jgi:hypothetical protein
MRATTSQPRTSKPTSPKEPRARQTDPAPIIASLAPREIKVDPHAEMTDDQIEARIRQLLPVVLGEC